MCIFLGNCGKQDSKMKTYVVCLKCCALYKMEDCIIEITKGVFESAKCSNVGYPNHPQPTHQKMCNTPLMKQVKCRSKYKLKPHKVYLHNSLKFSIEKLINRPKCSEKCEHWRKRRNDPDMYTDIYDGNVWKSHGHSFLDLPGSLGLILNIDWFTPFKLFSWCNLPCDC